MGLLNKTHCCCAGLWFLAWAGTWLVAQEPAPSGLPAPLSVVNPLERVVSLRLEGELTINLALQSIGESVGIRFVLDNRALFGLMNEGEEARFPAPAGRRKVSEHLERLLGPEGLVVVPLDGTWLVTTDDRAFYLQMRQKVDVAWNQVPLEKALAELAKAKGVNLVVDPRQSAAGKVLVTLQLKGATLEAALRLAAEMAGLKPIPVGNVVFLTNTEGLRSLRAGGNLAGPGSEVIPAGLLDPEGFTGPAPALPPLLPVPNPRRPMPEPLPNPGPAAPPPGVPPMGAGPGAGAVPFFNDSGA